MSLSPFVKSITLISLSHLFHTCVKEEDRITSYMESVLQIGANSHGADIAFSHDPVPTLIRQGWRATLVEPQPVAAGKLRAAYAATNGRVRVLEAAFCSEPGVSSVPLYFINGSRTLGSNESDIRCIGGDGAISGTASFSRQHVMAHQRFYKFTPSQCRSCAARLGRPLPPTCMRRVYADNLQMLDVRCVRTEDVAPDARSPDAVVIDAEGQDGKIVLRLLDDFRTHGARMPFVIVYEHAHLRAGHKQQLAASLQALGFSPYRSGKAARGSALPNGMAWTAMRHALNRVNAVENSLWVRNQSHRLQIMN